ncbi:hybrid sensory kinase [Robiginitalea biformata HTCC2501]|uniref:histidine kinase n=1 Tax=Robiginitalea biformata (strain ATCC BAA-864 / DSM 15991 / KCTC 12146 / HTCC2501) TaxID=313596 RepID=A4CPC4_ROBBH|nr:hybrid sensory kinase [Robiginitalea biformata HTCC2501]
MRHTIALIFLVSCFSAGWGLHAQLPLQEEREFDVYINQARVYWNRDDLELALEELDKAAEWAEEQQSEKDLIDCYHYFALIYLDMDKEETAQFNNGRAALMLEEIEYPYGTAVHYYINAKILYTEGNFFQAIFQLNEARQRTNDRNLLNRITLLEADNLRSIDKYEQAETNYNSLLVNTDPYEREFLRARAYLGLARLDLVQELLPEGIENAQYALDIAESNGFTTEYILANELLANMFEQTRQFDQALASTRHLMHFKDSVRGLAREKAQLETADRIQTEYMSKEIQRQDEEIQELSESANRSELTAILSSAFLIIISLLAVSLYRNNQIKLKTNDLLHTKNRELHAARDAAVQAMEAKTNFLSTVSHELRTPLYAVTGLTHLLLEENPSKEQQEHLKALKFSGDYLLNFINDILQINKIDADKLEMLEIEFNLKKILTEVMNSLQQTAKESKTEMILDFDPEIPSHLMSDPVKLSQVFMNLMGNALKFTKNGEVLVLARLVRKEDDRARVYFEVRDTGIGISEEKQKTIFDSFEQGSIQINREYGGTGLGLTIVKSLLGLFGSTIQLESTLGQGSSFFFELDFKCKDDLIDEVPFEVTPKEYDFKGLHLLIVEDNKINQVITRKMLAKKEISSDIANNGTEAIQLASSNSYDGILMDIHMPGISGVEATQEIRKFDPETPIIALTAISLDDSLEAFYAAGCNDVVTKPFKPEVFYQKIGENILEPKLRKTLS